MQMKLFDELMEAWEYTRDGVIAEAAKHPHGHLARLVHSALTVYSQARSAATESDEVLQLVTGHSVAGSSSPQHAISNGTTDPSACSSAGVSSARSSTRARRTTSLNATCDFILRA